jgi:hypothetical protein
MNKSTLILILLFLIQSCGIIKQDSNAYNPDQQKFRIFIHRFKVINLPYSFDQLCTIDSTINVDLDMDNDSIFIGFVGPCITIGLLPDTSKYFKVIYGIGATCYVPNIAIYKKDGTKISQEQLAFGCGVGPGYQCYDSVYISSKNEIIHLKIEHSYQPDIEFLNSKSLALKKVTTEKYRITKSGRITKTKTIKTTATNTVGKVNLLVTVFAITPAPYIWTNNLIPRSRHCFL